jgi:hypothetical protein
LNFAYRSERLHTPIPNRDNNDFPIVQYANDTIIILQADVDELSILKDLLEEYSAFIGLKVNYHKSSLIPINMLQEEANVLASLILVAILLKCPSIILVCLWVPPSLQ